MTPKQFALALDRLGTSTNGAAHLLGIARSTVYRILAGNAEVPPSVEKLIDMYLRHGVPDANR